ncbi:hypothetical protein BDY19DRAFT_978045 [Irpex rosettiformis]|uniref:Uncharacterized protein n=1 Tax=Irpex rosettiformis TaxID=378272 RepID=A0ACB8TNA6_9APHY|nr:hypothetical protein BDY19DRAFT_978045 [Irpex rosettiformis]
MMSRVLYSYPRLSLIGLLGTPLAAPPPLPRPRPTTITYHNPPFLDSALRTLPLLLRRLPMVLGTRILGQQIGRTHRRSIHSKIMTGRCIFVWASYGPFHRKLQH